MVEGGTVLIGKGLKIQELLDEDNEEDLLRLIESGKVERYQTSDFDAAFLRDLRHDRHLLHAIQALWRDLGEVESPDPKLSQFITELQNNRLLKGRKLIIFTESAETGRYLYQHLQRHFADQVLFYSSHGGYSQGRSLNKQVARADRGELRPTPCRAATNDPATGDDRCPRRRHQSPSLQHCAKL
jgi:ERCC4-related helicase